MMRVALEIAIILVVTVGILAGCGLLMRPLVPWRARPFYPLLAPFFGLAFFAGVADYCGAAGLPLARTAWLFVGLAAAGWITALVRRRLGVLRREILAVLAVCALGLTLALWPLFSLGYLTSVGATSDAYAAAARAEYLQHSTNRYLVPGPGEPSLRVVRGHIHSHTGEVHLIGLLGLLTGHRAFELLAPVMALFFALTAGSTFLWARLALRSSRRVALAAAALVAINNLMLFPVFDNFLAQVLAASLFPLLCLFGVEGARARSWRHAAAFGVLLAAVVAIYPVFAVYAVSTLAVYWLVAWIRTRRWRDLPSALGWWLMAAVAALLANGVALHRATWELRWIAQLLRPEGAHIVGIGDIVVFPSPYEIVGLVTHAAAAASLHLWSLPRGATSLVALFAAAFLAYGWSQLSRRARLAAATLLLSGLALAAGQRFVVNWPHGYPYGYFKTVSLISFEALVLLAAGLVAAWRRPRLRAVTALAALAVLALNVMNTGWTIRDAVAKTALTRELIEVQQAPAAAPSAEWAFVDVTPGLPRAWLAYLWRDRPRIWFHGERLALAGTPHLRWALIEKRLDSERRGSSAPWYDPQRYEVVLENSRFALRKLRDPVLARTSWKSPWLKPGERLALELAPERRTIVAELAGQRSEAELGAGTPRRVRMSVYGSEERPARLEVNGAALGLEAGAWSLDLDIACFEAPGRLRIDNNGDARVLVGELEVLDSAPEGVPCIAVTPLRTGAVHVEQDADQAGRLRYQAWLWMPAGAEQALYRLGIHAADLVTGAPYGVWSLDFAPGKRRQSGGLEIDLAGGEASAELDGRGVAVHREALNLGQGTSGISAGYVASSAVWQLNPIVQFSVNGLLRFQRKRDGSILVTTSSPSAPLTVIPAP